MSTLVLLDDLLPEPEKKNLRKTSIETTFNNCGPKLAKSPRPTEDRTNEAPNYVLADLNCLSVLVNDFPCKHCGVESLIF